MARQSDAFPFKTTLSLSLLIDFWRRVGSDDDSPRSAVARDIEERLGAAPDLARPITDPSVLAAHRDLLDLMMVAVFPPALWQETIMAVTPPFEMRPFYTTPSFDRLQLFERGCPELPDQVGFGGEALSTARAMRAYYWILSEFYEVDLPVDHPLVFGLTDPETGLEQYFKVDINTHFATVERHGALPELSQEQIERLLAEPLNLARWAEALPPRLFEFHGFIVLTATEVTEQTALSALKADLLQQDAMSSPEKIDRLQRRLRALLRQPDLELGLICLQRDDIAGITGARTVGRSLLLGQTGAPACPYKADSFYAHAYERRTPLVVGDLSECSVCTGFEQHLRQQGFRTLLLAPLRFEDRLIGLLELASPRPNAVSSLAAMKLDEAVALFATGMKRMIDEQEDRVQAVIKEHYTAIHPAVEWRFQEVAQRFLAEQALDRMAQIEPIVFHEVYPLYGLTDIRNSSTHRSEAIQADLQEQLSLALDVIVEAAIARHLPVLDEVSYRISRYADRIRPGASSEDETNVLDFLQHDVEPLFERLATFGERVRKRIETYQEALDPELKLLFRQRKDFIESVTLINDTISAYLNVQEEHAQAMFPHYFEKFKTDGVDYNIYVGASLVEDDSFDVLYLQNLRLWQLMTMCGVEWELRQLKPRLKMPLDGTHLILVQSAPLSIRFRMEEKQFDVDGAYNIRYEIVKKRIDKAVVQGSGERLTQPGKIAIVYSQAREALEYRRYLEYLQAAGYITDEIETFELESMPGAHGLKALRVSVAEEAPESSFEVEPARVQDALREVSAT